MRLYICIWHQVKFKVQDMLSPSSPRVTLLLVKVICYTKLQSCLLNEMRQNLKVVKDLSQKDGGKWDGGDVCFCDKNNLKLFIAFKRMGVRHILSTLTIFRQNIHHVLVYHYVLSVLCPSIQFLYVLKHFRIVIFFSFFTSVSFTFLILVQT